MKSYARIQEGENILLLYDDTMVRGGRNGFIITDQKIYCRPLMNRPGFVHLRNIESHEAKDRKDMGMYEIMVNHQSLILIDKQTGGEIVMTLISQILKDLEVLISSRGWKSRVKESPDVS